MINPALNSLLYYGKVLSNRIDDDTGPAARGEGRGGGNVITTKNPSNPDDYLEDIPQHKRFQYLKQPLHVARDDAQKIMKRLNQIKNDKVNVETRNKIMQQLIPGWFPKSHASLNSGSMQDNNNNHDVVVVSAKHVDGIVGTNHVSAHEDNVGVGVGDVVRTLENKAQHGKQSSCPRDVKDISTTLVVQSTLDRLPILSLTCTRWKGPIVAVVYLLAEQVGASSSVWDEMVQEYSDSCPQLTLIPYVGTSLEERKLKYPINRLRNVGLDHVVTSYVLVLDVDLIPSIGLDEALNHAIAIALETRVDDDGNRSLDPKDAIVVPAFERKTLTPCESLQDCLNRSLLLHNEQPFIPQSMEDLRSCVANQECIVFQSDVNWEGHFDTQSMAWLEKNDTSSLTTIPCLHSQRYEPYVVIPWCPLEKNAMQRLALHAPRSPYYDERFYGYGKNKIQQIAHLRESGFKFTVMPATGFVVHLPHPESETKEIWNDKMNYDLHDEMDRLYPQYLDELRTQYMHAFVETKMCNE
jgi:hypothetical protein